MNLSGPDEESISGINIAPLVDVVLVLLIIFMATAPLIHHRAINVNVPRAAHSEPKATETLKVVLNEKGELHMGDKPIAVEELPFQLSAMVRLDSRLHVSVLADQSIPYGQVVAILDIVRGAGVKKVALEVRSKRSITGAK